MPEESKGTHEILFSGKVVTLGNLAFGEIKEEVYKLIFLPLNVEGCEAAPARAVLIDEENGLESFD
ncbi:MAG: hypothetical protein ABIH92_04530 [Nanoarchaeota archaeon]